MASNTLEKIHVALWKRKVTLREYYRRIRYGAVLKNIEEYKDKFKGERCFVIGTGPSLTVEDLETLQSEHTFASNGIYKYLDKTDWKPEFYGVCDRTYYLANKENIDSVNPTIRKFFPLDFGLEFGINEENRYFSRIPFSVENPKFRDDARWGLQEGSTITYFLLQLAVYMGFSEIYLLGIDFNYSLSIDNKGNLVKRDGVKDYAYNDKAANYTLPNLEASYYSYKSAQQYGLDHADVKFYNATRGGKLEVFDRVDFDSLFNKEL